jgi:hypothetical protein
MGSRFENSLAIVKSSWSVIRSDKQVLWLPVISMLATVVVAVSFIVPIWLVGNDGTGSFRMGPAGWLLAAVAYFALAYVTIFFNAALVYAANERLEGRPCSVSEALAGARARAGVILPWALVSASVSIVLRVISERSGLVGRIVVGIVGMAWSLVTFLVLPILVVEQIGVGAAITRSKDLFKKTWGENVIGQAGVGIIGLLAAIPALVVMGLLAATGVGVLIGAGVAVGFVWMLGVSVVMSALSAVFQTALYRYASTGEVPHQFDQGQIESAFRPRRDNGGTGNGPFGGFGGNRGFAG